MQFGNGNFSQFINYAEDGNENGLSILLDELARPGEYCMTVKTTGMSYELRSRVEIGFIEGEVPTVLAASEIVPVVWQRLRFYEYQWTLQIVNSIVEEGTAAVGKPL